MHATVMYWMIIICLVECILAGYSSFSSSYPLVICGSLNADYAALTSPGPFPDALPESNCVAIDVCNEVNNRGESVPKNTWLHRSLKSLEYDGEVALSSGVYNYFNIEYARIPSGIRVESCAPNFGHYVSTGEYQCDEETVTSVTSGCPPSGDYTPQYLYESNDVLPNKLYYVDYHYTSSYALHRFLTGSKYIYGQNPTLRFVRGKTYRFDHDYRASEARYLAFKTMDTHVETTHNYAGCSMGSCSTYSTGTWCVTTCNIPIDEPLDVLYYNSNQNGWPTGVVNIIHESDLASLDTFLPSCLKAVQYDKEGEYVAALYGTTQMMRYSFEDDFGCFTAGTPAMKPNKCSEKSHAVFIPGTDCDFTCESGYTKIGNDCMVDACGTGYQEVNNECILICPQDVWGLAVYLQCPAGYRGVSKCDVGPQDLFACEMCSVPPGQRGLAPCTNCSEWNTCLYEPCPVGTYGEDGICHDCLDGWVSSEGASACLKFCTAGMEAVNGVCVECPVNFFAPAGTDPCQPCAHGFHQPATGQSECTPCFAESVNVTDVCEPGEMLVRSVADLDAYYALLDVDKQNTYDLLALCAASYACIPCKPGYFEANQTCHECQLGFYQPNFMETECWECGEGYTTTSTGADDTSDCVCMPGFEHKPLPPDQWVLGDPEVHCATVCANIGLQCNATAQTLTGEDELKSAFAQVGIDCGQYVQFSRFPPAPFLFPNHLYTPCFGVFDDGGVGTSTCDESWAYAGEGHQALCRCVSP